MKNNNIVKAVRATVKFSEQIQVDGYLLPDGEFRVGKTSISNALGYSKMWVGRKIKEAQTLVTSLATQNGSNPSNIVKNKPQTIVTSLLKKLSGEIRQIEVDGVIADTLSLDDFRVLIRYADRDDNFNAQAILDALLDVGLEDWFRLSFGLNQQTLEQKQAKFDQSYIVSIKWLEEDRRDIKVISEIDDRFLEIADYTNWSLA